MISVFIPGECASTRARECEMFTHMRAHTDGACRIQTTESCGSSAVTRSPTAGGAQTQPCVRASGALLAPGDSRHFSGITFPASTSSASKSVSMSLRLSLRAKRIS